MHWLIKRIHRVTQTLVHRESLCPWMNSRWLKVTCFFYALASPYLRCRKVQGCIQKFPDCVDKEINNSNKHSLRSNTKSNGGKTHYTDPQNSDTTVPSGRELYHLQFPLQAVSPETFSYTLVCRQPNMATVRYFGVLSGKCNVQLDIMYRNVSLKWIISKL
jgi:hypothetical protein